VWTGNAKDQAVQAVTTFTNSARSKVDEATRTLTAYIDRQLAALRSGDAYAPGSERHDGGQSV
jgi:hypothetical protein